jgi:hypothetical protein
MGATAESLEACVARLSKVFEDQGIDPKKEKVKAAIQGYCTSGSQELVLITEKKRPDPTLTIDALGSYRQGNINSGSASMTIAYQREWTHHGLELSLSGEYLKETDGFTYHKVSATVQEEFFLSNHWSLFGFAALGRNTQRELAFSASEFLGVSFNVLGREADHQIKLSSAVGHRFEQALDGQLVQTDEDGRSIGFSNNNFLLSHRLKYTGKFLHDTVELAAAAWFQHILFSPEQNGAPPRWMDLNDYRVLLQLSVKVKIADLGRSSELFFALGGTYEYFSKTLSSFPDDLAIQAGFGVRF